MEVVDKKLQRHRSKRERELDLFIWGVAEDGGNDPKLKVDPRLGAKARLEAILHEMLHYLNPDWTEAKVNRIGRRMANIFWKDRWRRVEKTICPD